MLTKAATTAQQLQAGDNVESMAAGRFTVATVEAVEHGAIRVTSTKGRALVVQPAQMFFRFDRKAN